MSLPITPGTYAIDSAHSHLGFAIRHLGISTIRGAFTSFTGSLTVGDDLAATSAEVTADMTSVQSGNEMRDGHLHSDQFFDTANHPTMSFTSTSIEADGDDYLMHGNLTIRGTTKPVTLKTEFNGEATFPMDGSTHFGFEARGQIARSEFGVSFGVPMASDTVKLILEVQFVRPAV
jgi:polyisoprenoid-binding protein YceI